MKIVSLLPSATEIVYALGLGDALVGVTDECDFPPDAVTKPVVSRSALPQGRSRSPAEIDASVRAQVADGEPLYVLDTDLLRREQPDVILTQDLCRVCAVPAGQVETALAKLGLSTDTRVVSLDPNTLDEVIAQLETVGELLGAGDQGRWLAEVMRTRVTKAKETAARLPSIRVVAIDWSAPPSVAGHWVPEMVQAVGGSNLLNDEGGPARPVTHREVRDAMPEVLVFMPCGYYLEEAEEEGQKLLEHPELADTPAARNGNVFAVDATSFFSRPGPRIVDGIEILGWAIHPEAYPQPPPGTIARIA
jgi:iron complex transport system substrate-binding protein